MNLDEILLAHEPAIRLGAFAAVFMAMALWELLAPRRRQVIRRLRRWPSNLGIVVLDTVLVRLAYPVAAVGVAMLADARGWGLLHAAGVPDWIAVIAAVILLDLAIYLQHVLVHAVPVLWRLHRMHHADLEFDVTTGTRFHPLEILLSMAIKLGVVAALGAPVLAVLIFEVLLNATSMFNHGNVRLPERFDRVLRWIVVTPEMHRVHHSVVPRESAGLCYVACVVTLVATGAAADDFDFSLGNLERKLATFDPGGRYITRPIERRVPGLSVNGSYYLWSDALLTDDATVGFRAHDHRLLQMQNLFEAEISYRFSPALEITSINHFLYDAAYDVEDASGLYAGRIDREFEYYNDFRRIVRELYLSYRTPRLDVVLGKQQIAWGKMDGQFIDVINPMDFRESVQLEASDYELRRLPLWMANLTAYIKGTSINLLWIPDFEKNLNPTYGAPWSSPLLAPDDATVRNNRFLLQGYTNPAGDWILPVNEPGWDRFEDHQVAVRLDSTAGALTWGLVYYYAWERDPTQTVSGRFADAAGTHLILQSDHERLHHFGITLDYAWVQASVPLIGSLPIVFRLEALYSMDVRFADFTELTAARTGALASGTSDHDTLRAALAFEFAFPANVSVILQPSLYYTFTWHPGLGAGFGGAVGDEWSFAPVFFIERPIRATRDRLKFSATITPFVGGPDRGLQGVKTKLIAAYEVSQYIRAQLVHTAYTGGDRIDLYGQYSDWDNIGIELQYEF